jgi:hypothetical protein
MLIRRLARFHEHPLGHVPTTGNLARWLSAPWALVIAASSAYWLVNPTPGAPAGPKPSAEIAVWVAFLLIAIFLLVRGAMVGVFVEPQRVMVRSWWRTWRFERGEGVTVDLAYWSGLLTSGASGWPFWILTFTREGEFDATEAQATIAVRRVNAAVMRELSCLLAGKDTGQ